MQKIEILVSVPSAKAETLFRRLADFSQYPRYTDTVRKVTVTTLPEGRMESAWEVKFRDGILCWTEEDWVDADRRTLDFKQRTGDMEYFAGGWRIDERGEGADVCFHADFDLGIPTLADILEPIAKDALRENIHQIIIGVTAVQD